MIFTADYAPDGTVERVHLGDGDFDAAVRFDRDLLDHADSRFLSYDKDAGIITVCVEEGTARYRVTGVGGYPRFVDADLVGVDRPVQA